MYKIKVHIRYGHREDLYKVPTPICNSWGIGTSISAALNDALQSKNLIRKIRHKMYRYVKENNIECFCVYHYSDMKLCAHLHDNSE